MKYNVYQLLNDPNWVAPPPQLAYRGRKATVPPLPPVIGKTLLGTVEGDFTGAVQTARKTYPNVRISVRRD